MLAAVSALPGGWRGGLGTGNRGRSSSRRLDDSVRGEVLALAEGMCQDYNDQHLTDVLREEHGLQVSRLRYGAFAAVPVWPARISTAAGGCAGGGSATRSSALSSDD